MILWALQRQLIYLPYGDAGTPAAAGLDDAEEIALTTGDGLDLAAWHVPARDETVATVLFLPGNAGNRSYRAPLADRLSERGYATLLVDYRGYGGNPGSPSEEGLYADARAARAWLADREDEGPLVYMGESLGAAVSIQLAVEAPPTALVLRSPFTSLADVGRLHYPFLPVRRLLKDRFPSADRIDAVDAPILVVAGTDDGIVPADQSMALYEAAEEPKRLRLLPGIDHNDPELLTGDEMIEEIVSFLDEHAASRG